MKKLVILGAGTAGTMIANKLSPELDRNEWQITIVDQYETHYYQPGFIFIPFGFIPARMLRNQREAFPRTVSMLSFRK